MEIVRNLNYASFDILNNIVDIPTGKNEKVNDVFKYEGKKNSSKIGNIKTVINNSEEVSSSIEKYSQFNKDSKNTFENKNQENAHEKNESTTKTVVPIVKPIDNTVS